MAQAIQKLYPGTLLGFGPPIDDGFYYDYIFPDSTSVSESDLPAIEETMREIIKENQSFEREDLAADEALERIREMNEPHKLEYAEELIGKRGQTDRRRSGGGGEHRHRPALQDQAAADPAGGGFPRRDPRRDQGAPARQS